MLGLRLAEGVDLEAFAQRFGVRAEERWEQVIASLTAQGLVESVGDHLRLTEPKGLFLASEAMSAFL